MKSTKDIYLAACWMALGAIYERTDKTDRKHMEFFFSAPMAGVTGELKDIPILSLDTVGS